MRLRWLQFRRTEIVVETAPAERPAPQAGAADQMGDWIPRAHRPDGKRDEGSRSIAIQSVAVSAIVAGAGYNLYMHGAAVQVTATDVPVEDARAGTVTDPVGHVD